MSSKNKLAKFEENKQLKNVIQPSFNEVFNRDYKLKGKWNQEHFGNDHRIVLELGCGKGEYTVGLAQKYPDKNFIGIDIKGARIWKGATIATKEQLHNVAFIRTQIEMIESFFDKDEVSEIWITFPDPQLKKRRNKKRLTAPRFLNHYRTFLQQNGLIHLKTDSYPLHEYTRMLVNYNELKIHFASDDLYNSDYNDDILDIKTFYEQQFLDEGLPITYLKFGLDNSKEIVDFPED